MRKAKVYILGVEAGELVQNSLSDYEFTYNDSYIQNDRLPALCLNMPKSTSCYKSASLFPIFSNMLSEGVNRRLQSQYLKIDEQDDFSILLSTANYDTIGGVTIQEI